MCQGTFPSVLKHANITPVIKKGTEIPKKTTNRWDSYADDNTLYGTCDTIEEVKLQSSSK